MKSSLRLQRVLREAQKAAWAQATACSSSTDVAVAEQNVVPSIARTAVHAAQTPSLATRDACSSFGSAAYWWAAAGVSIAVGQGVRTAHAEEEQQPEASTSNSQPPDLVSNKSTAQWRLYTNIGHEHFRKGDVDRAERYLVRALDEARKGFGAEDGHVAAACNNLAELYRNMGNLEKAEPLYKEALQILEAAYGQKDPRYATALQHVAGFYRQQQRFGAARQHFQLSLKAVDASLGAQHPMFAQVLMQLADLERSVDNKQQAVVLLRQALSVLDAQGPPAAEDALQAANRLGQMLVISGQGEEGVAMLRRCVQQAEALRDGDGRRAHSLQLLHLGSLAEALVKTGALTEARDLFHKSLRLGSGEGARSKLLVPGLLVNCADVELRIGDQTGQRDSFQRAHNLAQQATEHYRARWTKLVAIRSRRDTRSWWQRVGKSQEAAEIEATPATVLLCYHWAKAQGLLAKVQERLERPTEAQGALLEALEVLRNPAANPAAKEPQKSLTAGAGAREPWVQAEIQYLQLVVDVLYSLLRLVGDDEKSRAMGTVSDTLQELSARLPGLENSPQPDIQGITALGGRVWNARKRLNDLQVDINLRKQSDASSDDVTDS